MLKVPAQFVKGNTRRAIALGKLQNRLRPKNEFMQIVVFFLITILKTSRAWTQDGNIILDVIKTLTCPFRFWSLRCDGAAAGVRCILCGTGSELGGHWRRMASAVRVPYHSMPSVTKLLRMWQRSGAAVTRPGCGRPKSAGAAVSMFCMRRKLVRRAVLSATETLYETMLFGHAGRTGTLYRSPDDVRISDDIEKCIAYALRR